MKESAETSLLKDQKREIDGNPDLPNTENVSPLGDQVPSAHQGLLSLTPVMFSINQRSVGDRLLYVCWKLPSQYWPFSIFHSVVPVAMDRAIREIVPGIVQRSVNIACQTTKELVLKDYALEPDESRIYNAAHLMVANLAGSLVHVTCKEHLSISMSGHLRQSLQVLTISNVVLEQIVQIITNENLDLGCAAIEKATKEMAIRQIDADIALQLSLRKRHRGGAESQDSHGIYAASSSSGHVGPKPEGNLS